MEIRDIVNRDIVNLSNCDEEPIHIPGTIQPHGFLLAVSRSDFNIQFCSENVTECLGAMPSSVLGKPLEQFIPKENYELFLTRASEQITNSSIPATVIINNKRYYLLPHLTENSWILEFEYTDEGSDSKVSVIEQTVRFVRFMEQSISLKELCQKITEEIRELTGYDRVMVYRFDKHYNGEIFAEAKREDLEAFLGLHYPHTDIPVQARQLYIKNLLRLIPDISYTPVPIYTINDTPEKNLDLSLALLRSVSPIHVQYLQNMGVGGTLTISLMHQRQLWGLIACHHYSTKYIDYTTRISAQLQAHFLVSQISVRQQAEDFDRSKEVNAALESLVNQGSYPSRESLIEIVNRPQLLALCNAAGVAILLDDTLYSKGRVPSKEQIHKLVSWAGSKARLGIFSTAKLSDEYIDGEEICDSAAGIIFYSLASNNSASIIWFNPETIQEVHWAGDPEKAIIKDENGLHPRKSFATWKQIVKCEAREWTTAELSAAASFAYSLQKHVSLILLTEEEISQRLLLEQLKETNEELENINWISTHDLKEPLRKIRIHSSRLLKKEQNLSEEVTQSLTKMDEFARRMQELISDLTTFGKLGNQEDRIDKIDLRYLTSMLASELSDTVDEKNATIVIGELPVIQGIPILVRQLLINLLQNALKFSSDRRHPIIEVRSVNENAKSQLPFGTFDIIEVRDNGIGFDNNFSRDIFKIFNRLHLKTDFPGSGIGLALCKKIMQIHQGKIEAFGTPDEGAIFTLYFPRTRVE